MKRCEWKEWDSGYNGRDSEHVCSCQHMHDAAAVPAEVQLCLESALLSDTDATTLGHESAAERHGTAL